MKKITWALLAFLLLFTACNSDDEYAVNEPSGSALVKNNHFYGVKTPDVSTIRGIAQRSKLWHPSANIKVKFLNGTSTFQNKVKTYAKEWEQHMSVRFEFVTSGNADVRVGFDWNDERYITWSYIGTDCKFVTNQNEATMSFAYFDSATDAEIRADVLRAFGQALGLELEHRHLNFDAGWTSRIADYWEGEIEDIPWESLKQYVFDPLLSNDVLQTEEYDTNSIMIWPFTRRYADNTQREQNYDLSEKDIEFIGVLYPPMNYNVAFTMKRNIEEYNFLTLDLESSDTTEITVDWGDGTIDKLAPQTPSVPNGLYYYASSHSYNIPGNYILKVYADPESLTYIFHSSNGDCTTELDISKCINLTRLELDNAEFVNLDISKNLKLQYLQYEGNMFNLDLSKHTLLEHIELSMRALTSLDVSKHTKLKELLLKESSISELDLSNNKELVTLNISNSPITKLNLYDNTALSNLSLQDIAISELDLSNNNKITYLKISDSLISELDLSSMNELVSLYISNLLINELDLSNNNQLKYLDIFNSPVNELHIVNNPLLWSLKIQNTLIGDLDISSNNQLYFVDICNTPLERDIPTLINFARSLPSRPSGIYYSGTIYLTENADAIANILQFKNWRYTLR